MHVDDDHDYGGGDDDDDDDDDDDGGDEVIKHTHDIKTSKERVAPIASHKSGCLDCGFNSNETCLNLEIFPRSV